MVQTTSEKENRKKQLLSKSELLNVRAKVKLSPKEQLILKANCQVVNSSKKQTNEFVFTTMQRVFIRFFEEEEDTKKNFSKLPDL